MSADKIQNAENIRHGIELCKDYLLEAMYNANDRSMEGEEDFMENSQLTDFYERVMAELENFIESAIIGEPGIDTFDQAMLHESAKQTVMKRIGLKSLK